MRIGLLPPAKRVSRLAGPPPVDGQDLAGLTPGQRVLSRGGYVVDLSGRVEPIWRVP
jgi:hypothetical protein